MRPRPQCPITNTFDSEGSYSSRFRQWVGWRAAIIADGSVVTSALTVSLTVQVKEDTVRSVIE